MGRTLEETFESLLEMVEAIKRKDYEHQFCALCHAILHPGKRRETDYGLYEDNETLCGHCISDRNEQLGRELREGIIQ
jgi:hypothetical protein